MKVTRAHMEAIASLVAPLDTEDTRDRYRRGAYSRADQTKDLNMRYRWDLYYAAQAWRAHDGADYMDAHLDTALRRIVSPL